MKKFIGLLLALCLIAGLLPVAASADNVKFDDSAKILLLGQLEMLVVKGGVAQYARTTEDGEVQKCSVSDNWNIKFEYVDDWAVLTLRGAQLGKSTASGEFTKEYMKNCHAIEAPSNAPFYRLKVVVEKDSVFDTGFGGIACQGSKNDVYMADIWIESVGNAKLDINCHGGYSALRAADYEGVYEGTLTINANVTITQIVDYRYATCLEASHIVINGGNIILNSANACVVAQKSFTMNGGNVTISTSNSGVISPIQMPSGEVVINSGILKMYKPQDASGGGIINCEKLTINGGTVYGEGCTYAINASQVEFNGGIIELKALSENNDTQVFIDGAPDLAKYNNPTAVMGSSKADVEKYTAELADEFKTGYFMVATSGSAEAPAIPSDEPEPTDPPATSEEPEESKEPEASQEPEASKEPEETKDSNKDDGNKDNNKNDTNDSGSLSVLLIVLAVILVIVFGAGSGVVAFIVLKKKSEAVDEEDEE